MMAYWLPFSTVFFLLSGTSGKRKKKPQKTSCFAFEVGMVLSKIEHNRDAVGERKRRHLNGPKAGLPEYTHLFSLNKLRSQGQRECMQSQSFFLSI